MADPQLARGIRAQVVLPGKSGLPEDRFITTWAFQSVGAQATEAEEIEVADQLIEFFNVPGDGFAAAVGTMISGAVERDLCEVRTYRMLSALPRPVTVHPFTLVGADSSTNYPEEVAATLSFYSVTNTPRTRGRVYLGPLTEQVGEAGSNGRTQITAGWMNSLLKSGQVLMEKPLTEPEWCILSPTSGLLLPVTNIWVDNAFDTQRRRGQEATQRFRYPAA